MHPPGVVANFGWGSGTGAGKRVQDMTELEIFVRQQKEAGMAHPQDRAPLDRWRADEILEPNRALWGLTEIAACLGVSVGTARRWAQNDATGMPVSKPGGRWFSERRALLAWRRHKGW